jgi:hypothetical protein
MSVGFVPTVADDAWEYKAVESVPMGVDVTLSSREIRLTEGAEGMWTTSKNASADRMNKRLNYLEGWIAKLSRLLDGMIQQQVRHLQQGHGRDCSEERSALNDGRWSSRCLVVEDAYRQLVFYLRRYRVA